MTSKTKLIRTTYLYLAVAVSLIFVAIGLGTLLNTGLKAVIFKEAEKRGYSECNFQAPFYPGIEVKRLEPIATDDQKSQLEQMLKDYAVWNENNSGDKCIRAARQNNIVNALTMILVALPILGLHWRIIKQEKKDHE